MHGIFVIMAGKKREFSDLSSCDPRDDANIHRIMIFISLASCSLSSRSRCFHSLPLNFSSVLASSVAPTLCFFFLSVARRQRRAVGPSLVGSSLISTLEQ